MELFVGVFEVLAHGGGGDTERGGDLRVRGSFGEVIEDLALAWGQPVLVVRM